MSADIPRRAYSTAPRRPTPPPQPGPRPPVELSPEAKRQDLAANDLFEKNAAANAAPTDTRPALVHIADIQQIRTRLTTGAGRLDALTKCTGWRLDFYLREKSGTQPFDPLTPAQEKDAREFFEKHGARLKGDKGTAPENPIRARDQQAAAQPAAPAPEPAPAAVPPVEKAPVAVDGLAAILAELKGLRGDVVALRSALEARPASPPAAASVATAPAPITYDLKDGETFADFWMESVKVGTSDETGAKTYKAQGHPYNKFGVRIWPEVLPELGLDAEALKPGVNPLPRRLRVRAVVDPDGKAKKVVGPA